MLATNPNNISDLLEFNIAKRVSTNYVLIFAICDLSSDQTPVLITISARIIKKNQVRNK